METRRFEASIKDFPNLVDAVFVGLPSGNSPDGNGWVEMTCNPAARTAVNEAIPGAHIAWRAVKLPCFAMAPGWQGFQINLPSVVATLGPGELPRHLLELQDLDDAHPDQLAMILAIAVKEGGLRAAIIREVNRRPELEIFSQSSGN